MPPTISVLMPTYKQAAFIRRAIASLQAQSFADWELLIVDDGSPDETQSLVVAFLQDTRIRYIRHESNDGLGAALNTALEAALGNYIAYLPSDDVYYDEHLQSLFTLLQQHPGATLVYSGVRHHYNHLALGQIEGYPLQLVQVLHHKTTDRWLERTELTTDDLERMYWSRLRTHGAFVSTDQVSCEWVDHPQQRHKLLQEPFGGINPYRVYYGVKQPLRLHTTVGNFIDEEEQYRRFRERPDTPLAPDGLKILLVGELAYNPERVLALEERGHALYGLWTQQPYWFNTVGPMPFGHVEEIARPNWRDAIRAIRPDVIYAQLNWQTVPFVHQVLMAHLGVPFVWHFKEGPFICLEKGMWSQLLDLYTHSDGQIYINREMRDWFATIAPDLMHRKHVLVLDGDLPKRDWFDSSRSPRLSLRDGAIHTVVPGRPIGLHPAIMQELAQQNIHVHFYGDFTQGQWKNWIAKVQQLAPEHLHIHKNVDQQHWVSEFSQYDAGWLHFQRSENGGDIRRADWDDLNYPARIATLAVAGVPLIQYHNAGAIVASATLAQDLDIGVFGTNADELKAQLTDEAHMQKLRENVWTKRQQFTFDYHADTLVAFFRKVIRG